VEAVLLSCLFQPCIENFSGFRSASLEHNASSAGADFSPLRLQSYKIKIKKARKSATFFYSSAKQAWESLTIFS
jgi:hypothetical protein